MDKSPLLSLALLVLLAGHWQSCKKKQEPVPQECPESTYFTKYQYDGYTYWDSPRYTTPDGRWFVIRGNRLIRVTPQNEQFEVYPSKSEDDIIVPSVRIRPDGGIFFLDGYYLHFIDPEGFMTTNSDFYAGTSHPFDDRWSGASFLTPEGYYGFVDRDGTNAFRINIRDQYMQLVDMVTVTNTPDENGDFLGAYVADGKYNTLHTFTFQGTRYVKNYRFYKQGNTVYMQKFDVQVPQETLGKDWLNYTPDGTGHATFDIEDKIDKVTRHYRIDPEGGAQYDILPASPVYIQGPNCYYTWESIEIEGDEFIFKVVKHENGEQAWSRVVPTGHYEMYETHGWANSQGVFMLSTYFPENYSGSGSCRMYFSADGQICD